MQWTKMSGSQKAAARALRDRLNSAGVTNPGQCGPEEISVSQVAKHLDTVQAWADGLIGLAALCDAVGWTDPTPAEPAAEPTPEPTACILSVIRGDAGADAPGDELGPLLTQGLDLPDDVWAWIQAHTPEGDDLSWVLVTPASTPGRPANIVAQREASLALPARDGLEALYGGTDPHGLEEAYAGAAELDDDVDR